MGISEQWRARYPEAAAKYDARRRQRTAPPRWVGLLSRFRREGERGVGDTAQRLLGKAGKRFKRLMKALGAPCGCDGRRGEWNQKYPYPPN